MTLRTLPLNLVILASFLASPVWAVAQNPKGEGILAFTQPWIKAQDYVWKRVSESRLEKEKKVRLRIEDEGRFRVEFVKLEDESAVLNVWVLAYNYETQIDGEAPVRARSELVGTKLPVIWFHWALGYAMGASPGLGAKRADDQQASLILDLLDFRGFVPASSPKTGAEWALEVVPDRGKAFKFREELEREFKCTDASQAGEITHCAVTFEEIFKVTPDEEGRTWELHEKKGKFWVSLPDGLVDGAEWTNETTESVAGVKDTKNLLTKTTVTLKRMEPKQRAAAPRKKSPVERAPALPLPPR